MGLALTFRQGDDFYLGDERFVVEAIERGFRVTVRNQAGVATVLTPDRPLSIHPRVTAQVGDTSVASQVKIVFKAPLSVIILSGDNYRKGNGFKPS